MNLSLCVVEFGLLGVYVDYVVIKGVVDMLIKGLVCELIGEGVCVNGVWFGIVEIDIYVISGMDVVVVDVVLVIFI